ncbi:helix-turn-helix transcriptional regulator [Ectothiorhodospira variabilis]|uniref:helix-turn-helix transcriptional regulator n=1 Tax=Ectothiorhodospira variabilis TaxID=505694 RepID=UPI001EFB5459|nr:helix-turn-helix transcriptional regulator [Ectothiorhodospira variabilis]MCG5495604.1 LuxR family transcriptional regulator [Ectothiorhodospira variabilis]MCG5498358.1 LuxR family transcriptional regulator [Ectothiorhodospira variabilis]MCG5503072.1 LuxR family transcriptional regulator [Ectothiorhodospira variabilis]MCG5506169.1 LuxR family transcriptional regulator [Ectothiorhodospira variabilis]
MFLSKNDWQAAGSTASYVAWLTAFPMSGMLLGKAELMLWFLIPHTLGLLVLGYAAARLPSWILQRLCQAGVVLTSLLTLISALIPDMVVAIWMIALGLGAAPVSLRVGQYLKGAGQPVATGVATLAGGNLLALALIASPLPATVKLTLLAVLLLALFPRSREPSDPGPGDATTLEPLLRYLPFILLFQVVSGLMYGGLMPAYGAVAWAPGAEVLFYGAGAVLALWLLGRYQATVTMLTAVLGALVAFALWQIAPHAPGIHGAMFAMMIAAGLVDLFLLSRILRHHPVSTAYGYGVGALCGGIILGKWLAMSVGGAAEVLAFAALIVLNLAALLLHIPFTRREPEPLGTEAAAAGIPLVPPSIAQLLSEQEQHVLEQVLEDKTYREIAANLAISESSVKTYMHRIYLKTGACRRHQLVEMVRQSGISDSDHPVTEPDRFR